MLANMFLEEVETLDISNTESKILPYQLSLWKNLKTLNIKNTDINNLPPCIQVELDPNNPDKGARFIKVHADGSKGELELTYEGTPLYKRCQELLKKKISIEKINLQLHTAPKNRMSFFKKLSCIRSA